MITGNTRLFAIIGDPIEHVRTPMAFNAYFAEQKIDAVCLPVHSCRDDVEDQGLSTAFPNQKHNRPCQTVTHAALTRPRARLSYLTG